MIQRGERTLKEVIQRVISTSAEGRGGETQRWGDAEVSSSGGARSHTSGT